MSEANFFPRKVWSDRDFIVFRDKHESIFIQAFQRTQNVAAKIYAWDAFITDFFELGLSLRRRGVGLMHEEFRAKIGILVCDGDSGQHSPEELTRVS